MSLRHLVLLRFQEGTEPAQIETIAQALRTLPALIPEIAEYRVGTDLALADSNWQFGIAADFATQADYVVYRDHAEHQRIIRDLVRPVVADRAAVQYDT